MNRMLGWVLATGLALAGTDGPAVILLDQAQEVPSSDQLGAPFFLRQTLTAGVDGVFDRIEVPLVLFSGADRDLIVGLGDQFTSPNLANVTFTQAELAPFPKEVEIWFAVDLSAFSIPSVAGSGYTIFVDQSDGGPNVGNWAGLSSGSYSGGQGFSTGGVPSAGGNGDWGFRTFVEVSTVPEPSSGALLGVGGLLLWRRRRE